jgi:hypothetical protein
VPYVRLVRERRREARVRHLCFGGRDFEFSRDYGLLLASRVCCGNRAAGASAFLLKFRPWFLVLSVVLLGIGFWQQRRAQQCAVRARIFGMVLLWTAVVIVVGMILFPQQIAGFIADRLSGP